MDSGEGRGGLPTLTLSQMLMLRPMLTPTFCMADTVDSTEDIPDTTALALVDTTADMDSGDGRGGLPTLPLSQMLMLRPMLTPTFCMADTVDSTEDIPDTTAMALDTTDMDSGEGKLSKECQHNTTTTCPTLPDCYRDTIKVQIEEEIPVLPVY